MLLQKMFLVNIPVKLKQEVNNKQSNLYLLIFFLNCPNTNLFDGQFLLKHLIRALMYLPSK